MLLIDRFIGRYGSEYRRVVVIYTALVILGLTIIAMRLFTASFWLGVLFYAGETRPSRLNALFLWGRIEALVFAGPYTVAAISFGFASPFWRIDDWHAQSQYVLWSGVGLVVVIICNFAAFLTGVGSGGRQVNKLLSEHMASR
jgi:hypothetical protein